MLGKIKRLLKREYQTLNRIEISESNLLYNYRYLSKLSTKLKIAPVLKSNAYGHSLTLVGKILNKVQTPFLCVDSLYEAYELLKAKIKTPILIMGYTDPENLKIKRLPFEYAVWDLDFVKVLNKFQKRSGIHIFVDTGMNREGVKLDELANFLEELKQFKNIKIVGLMTHLASATSSIDPLFKLQIRNFQKARDLIKKAGIKPKWFHLSSSDALINKTTRRAIAQISNVARGGIAIYGIGPDKNLKPVLKFTSKISMIKNLAVGDRVGYGGGFKISQDIVEALIPAGYNDGIDRRLSHTGGVIIKQVYCPIIGRVSMNITNLDVTKVENPRTGDEVTILSQNPEDSNCVQKIADLCKTAPHDILIHLHSSTRRVVVK